MENGGGESGEEDGKRRSLFLGWPASAQEKRESDEHAEQQSREQRMKIGAIEGEKRGGAGKFAERVEVGDGSRDQRGDCGGAGGARGSRALFGGGGEGLREGIHL